MQLKVIVGGFALTACAAWADPVGGTWVIDGDTLIVSNGTVTVGETLEGSVSKARINEGATLRIGTDAPFATVPDLLLFGTLDLNGHSLEIGRLSTRHPVGDSAYCIAGTDKNRYLASVEAMVTNSVGTTVTLSSTNSVFSGAVIAPNVKVVLSGSETAFFFGRTVGEGASQIDDQSEVLAMSRPTELVFVFKEVAGSGDLALLRLSELMPTYKGVPVSELGYSVTCKVQTPGLSTSTPSQWTDGDLSTEKIASATHLVSPETPHVITVTLSGRGYPAVDGYRIGTSETPAYTPKTWDVYASRVDDLGLVLVDRRVNDKVNRPDFNVATKADTWSNQLSDNYAFQWPLGAVVGSGTDLALTGDARFSVGDPLAMGAVSGDGKITLNQDSVIRPTSLADWSGVFSVDESYGFLGEGPGVQLSSVRGESEQKFAYENVNLSVGAAEAESTVKVLYDAMTAGTYARTRLRDGEGRLGVTVRAPGKEQYLAAQGSDYTGPTDVESGTLVVHGKTAGWTCSYIKIVPKKVPHAKASDYNGVYWAMNEFRVYANGQKVSIKGSDVTSSTGSFLSSEGANLVDDDETTRTMPQGGAEDDLPTITIQATESITFDAYDWYPDVRKGMPQTWRYPLELEIWVSSDGENWFLADRRTNTPPTQDADYLKFQGGDDHFALQEQKNAADLPTLDPSVCGTSSEGAAFVESVKARYFRFTCFQTFNSWSFEGETSNDKGWGLSEFSLKRNGVLVDWPAGSVVASDGLTLWTVSGSANAKFADNVRTGAETGKDRNLALYANGLGYVQIDAGEELEFDAYSLWTPPPSSAAKRLPRGWMLQVSANGTDWQTVDVHRPSEGDVCPKTSYSEYGPFSLQNRWPIPGAGNAIGDRSKVSVASGAALRLDAAFERVGGLSGAGSVNLVGHTLDLASQDAATVFSGSVSGAGALVISGEGEQAFDNADLSGVSTLKLVGGLMTGSVTFGGNNLVLDFAGGAFGASLSDIGALTVSGEVVCRPSAATLAARGGWRATIATETPLDAAAQAAFEATRFDLPRNWKGSVAVEPNLVTFTVTPPGLMLILR